MNEREFNKNEEKTKKRERKDGQQSFETFEQSTMPQSLKSLTHFKVEKTTSS
jgi:hypothetical protein